MGVLSCIGAAAGVRALYVGLPTYLELQLVEWFLLALSYVYVIRPARVRIHDAIEDAGPGTQLRSIWSYVLGFIFAHQMTRLAPHRAQPDVCFIGSHHADRLLSDGRSCLRLARNL